MNIRTKLIGTIVLGAALLVPVAQARPDDQAGPRGPGAIESAQASLKAADGADVLPADSWQRYVDNPTATHPDNRGGIHGPGAFTGQPAVVRPDDRAGVRGPGAIGAPEPSTATHPDNLADRRGPGAVTTVLVRPGSNGFDWGDALIGGLGGAGMALLLTGSAFLIMNQRNKVRTA
jgi:hypothetical protein